MKMFEFKQLLSSSYSIRTISFLFQIFLIILLFSTNIIQTQKYQEQTNQDLSQSDPIVWDTNSLYHKQHDKNYLYRNKRSLTTTASNHNQLVDACQSKMEIITPYYATNSKGKVRTVVNSELMQQAIQIETCVR